MDDTGKVGKFPKIKLLSLNVRGLNKEVKRKSIYNFLRTKQIDICFLQETYSSYESENKWSNEWGGECIFSHGTSHSKGVMILFWQGLDVVIKNLSIDLRGRYIFVETLIH